MENEKNTALILGANGKTGSRVMARLQALRWPVRAGSRNGHPRFDWEDKATWPAALDKIKSVYITFQPDLAVPGAVETIEAFTKQAVASGVEKLVLLSGRGEPEAQACEAIVQASGVEWTILRASWFCQNFSESYLLEPLLAGHVALPVADIGEPFVDADDIADAAVAALTEKGHHEQCYELTGPRIVTFREAIQEIAAGSGRSIQFEPIGIQQYQDMLASQEVPLPYIHLLTYLFSEVLDGRNASLADGVKQAIGRRPKDFSEYVEHAAANGAWK